MRSSDFIRAAAVAALAVGVASTAQAAATIVINNVNAAGVGFNDTTPATPVGGNTGTTVGEQRLIAFTYAANLWGAQLTSTQPIVINAQFSALTCTATTATLGSAGATSVYRDFANAPKANTWYSYALANKLAGAYLGTANAAQISANFNMNLGTTNCLPTSTWYYGLDSNEPANGIDFVAVLLHEMGHGVGFQTFTSGSTGYFLGASQTSPTTGFPSVWDHYLYDATNNVNWANATVAQRVASAISVNKLVWTGPLANGDAPLVLRTGSAGVGFSGVSSGSLGGTTVGAGEAAFGAALTAGGLTGEVMPVVSQTTAAGLTGPACGPLTAADAKAVNGKIALIDRGTCGFAVKTKYAQDAGAIGVLIANTSTGAFGGMSGSDATITIPAVMIPYATGVSLKTQLATRSRTNSGVFARIGLFGTTMAGADASGRLLMYAPSTFASGSSVSHFDTTATPNLLMEPAINADLGQTLVPPRDLTFRLLQDIGW